MMTRWDNPPPSFHCLARPGRVLFGGPSRAGRCFTMTVLHVSTHGVIYFCLAPVRQAIMYRRQTAITMRFRPIHLGNGPLSTEIRWGQR